PDSHPAFLRSASALSQLYVLLFHGFRLGCERHAAALDEQAVAGDFLGLSFGIGCGCRDLMMRAIGAGLHLEQSQGDRRERMKHAPAAPVFADVTALAPMFLAVKGWNGLGEGRKYCLAAAFPVCTLEQ